MELGPDQHQAAVPEQAPATQLRVRVRLCGHLGAHGAGLPSGDDLRIDGRAPPQQPSGVQARGDPRQPRFGRRGQFRRGAVHGRDARRREFLRQLHRHLQRAFRQSAGRRRPLVLQLFPRGQRDARGPQDLQNPLPSQASHNPGARRRGQHRLGDLRSAIGVGTHAQRGQRQLDQAPDARKREPADRRRSLVPQPRPRVGGVLRLDGRLVEAHVVHRHARGGVQRRADRRTDSRRNPAHGQQRRSLRRPARAARRSLLGAHTPLLAERKGEGHLFDGRFGAERAPLPQHLHLRQHRHRRLLEHEIHRHRPLLQTRQLQRTRRLPHAAGRAHDHQRQPHGARRGLRSLRHARRRREGRRKRRTGLQPAADAQADPLGPARRDAAGRRTQRPDRKQHPLVDPLARRPAALDGQTAAKRSTSTSGATA